jgi:hypothetical protein
MFIAASEQETKKPKKIKKENILAGKKYTEKIFNPLF